jgi:hypothetical protein
VVTNQEQGGVWSWATCWWLLQPQDDGDLVLKSAGGAVMWRSGTAGVGARVEMLWNGDLVVFD